MKEYKQGNWTAMEGLGDDFMISYRGDYVGKYYSDSNKDLHIVSMPPILLAPEILDLYNLLKQI